MKGDTNMKLFIYGDNVDTDVIIPARYLTTADPDALAAHCMEDIDPNFARTVCPGDMIVAGQNFGCGSSREHAPLAIKGSGIACVIAAGFARIFYRNAVNIGLPILECPAAVAEVRSGDELEVDLAVGRVINRTRQTVYQTEPMPGFVQEIIKAGGLLARLAEEDGKAVMSVIKKTGKTEVFDPLKIYYSLAGASDAIEHPLTDGDLRNMVEDIRARAWDGISTAELRDICVAILREWGHSDVAESFISD